MNKITATIPFSFKGNDYKPSITIDLDEYSVNHDDFSTLFHQVATENKIDSYSYEYEVLESSPVFFSQPTGLAKDFLINENHFDLPGYKQKAQENEIINTVSAIAKERLDIDNLNTEEELKKALMDAYLAGKSSVTTQLNP